MSRSQLLLAIISAVLLATASACAPRAAPTAAAGFRVVPGDKMQAPSWLNGPARAAERAGASAPQVIAVAPATAGERIGGFVETSESRCLLVLARGGSKVEDLDTFVHYDSGELLASDERTSKDASLILCPPFRARHLYVSARVAGGQGLIGLSVQHFAPQQGPRIMQRLGIVLPKLGVRTLDSPWPDLERQVAEYKARLGGEWLNGARVVVPVNPLVKTRLSFAVDQDSCVALLVSPAPDVGALDVVIEDRRGEILGRSQSERQLELALVCSNTPSDFNVVLNSRGDQGQAVLVIMPSAPGAPRELSGGVAAFDLGTQPDLARAVERQQSFLSEAGYATLAPAKMASLSDVEVLTLPLPASEGCSRIDVIAGSPLLGLKAQLYGVSGQLWSEATAPGSLTLYSCGREPASLELQATLRAGPVALLVTALKTNFLALSTYPAAAHRLLARLVAISRHDRDGGLGPRPFTLQVSPSVQDVSAHSLLKIPLILLPNQCLELVAALDRGANGVRLRVKSAGGQLLATDFHSHTVSAALCEPNTKAPGMASARSLVIELKAETGQGKLLFFAKARAASSTAPQISSESGAP